jgi:hypothetical protein
MKKTLQCLLAGATALALAAPHGPNPWRFPPRAMAICCR